MALTLSYDPVLSRVRLTATELGVQNSNSLFEAAAAPWAGVGGAVVRSTAQAHEGVASLLLTPDGVTATAQAQAEQVPASELVQYKASAWVRCAVARNVNIAINWSTAAGVFISQSFATFAVAANAWTLIQVVDAAPAGTGLARLIGASLTGTPPATNTVHIDEARLELNAATVSAVIERSTDGARWTTVRGGAAAKVATRQVALDDYEFDADVPNTYRVTAQTAPALPVPVVEDFEDAVLNVPVAGAWARSNLSAHGGAWSLKSATILDNQVSQATVTVPAGAATCTFWYRVSSEQGFDFFRFYKGAPQVLSASGAGVWTQSPIYAVAPGLVLTFEYSKDSSASAGDDAAFIDDLVFTGAPQVVTAAPTATITPTLGGVWIKSVAQPFLNRQIIVHDYSDVTRPSRSGLFDVEGRSMPVAVNQVRGSRRWTLEVLTQTALEAKDFDLVLASGDQLFIHVPADCDVPGGYVTVGDTSARRTARRSVRRIFDLPCVEGAAPGPDVLGATINWQTVLNGYSTWADVLAANATWAQLLDRVGSPQDVIVP